MNNDKIMTLGINQARKTMNDNKGGPFGAVITDKKGNIISISSNLVLETYDPTAHAEINAIREASKKLKTHDLSNCILYATGYPCPMCLSAIIWANIQTVYYGTNVNEAEEIGFRDDSPCVFYKDVYNNYVLVAKLDSDDIVVPDTTELKKFLMDLSIILNDEKALKRTKSRKEIN